MLEIEKYPKILLNHYYLFKVNGWGHSNGWMIIKILSEHNGSFNYRVIKSKGCGVLIENKGNISMFEEYSLWFKMLKYIGKDYHNDEKLLAMAL